MHRVEAIDTHKNVVPAQAGTHAELPKLVYGASVWVPAFALRPAHIFETFNKIKDLQQSF
jgi:hypothetical protein